MFISCNLYSIYTHVYIIEENGHFKKPNSNKCPLFSSDSKSITKKENSKLERRGKGGNHKEEAVVKKLRWRFFRPLTLTKQMPYDIVNDLKGLPRVLLSEPGGSTAEVLLYGAQVVSWKNEHGEELLFTRNKATEKSPKAFKGGISVCFPRLANLGPPDLHGQTRYMTWSLDNGPLHLARTDNLSSVDLILNDNRKDPRLWPCSFELRLHVSLSPGKLTLIPSLKNTDNKSFSFKFAVCNYLSVSDISEVRVEGLETLDYLDNLLQGQRFTEQADAVTFDGEVFRAYLNTPPKLAIIDHAKKRTIVLRKENLPDAVLWNLWNNTSKALPSIGGDDYKIMLSVDSANLEKPIILKPSQEWRGCQELSAVSSSYCSGHLDSAKVLHGLS